MRGAPTECSLSDREQVPRTRTPVAQQHLGTEEWIANDRRLRALIEELRWVAERREETHPREREGFIAS